MANSDQERDFRERDSRFFSQLSEEEQQHWRKSVIYVVEDPRAEQHRDSLRHAVLWLTFSATSFSLLGYVLYSVSRSFLPIRHFALRLAIPLFVIGYFLRFYDLFQERWQRKRFFYDE